MNNSLYLPLGEIFKTTSGGTPSRRNPLYYLDGTIYWVKSGELRDSHIYESEERITEKAIQESSAKMLPVGTLLVALYGANIGKLGILESKAATNQAVCAIYENRNFFVRFLFYYLLFKRSDLIRSGIGGAQPNISQNILRQLPVPVTSVTEQRRIVAKIDALFSELDKGVEYLNILKQQLKVYRKAVLKWAFEGKLTEQWRKNNNVEAAEVIWENIMSIRHNEANRLEYIPINEEFMRYLLPDEWQWVSIGSISRGVEYGTSEKSSKMGDVVVLRMGNIQNGSLVYDDLVYTSNSAEIEKYILHPGDVLFNRTNSPELVGKTAIYMGHVPSIFAGYLMRLNQISYVNPKYLNYYLNSPHARLCGNRVKTDGVNQSNINGKKLSSYPIPICSPQEQEKVVSEIESRLSVCDKLEQIVDENLAKADALRQSILKMAFEGRLVPQDPNDEPAEKLLERIQVDQQSIQKHPAKRRQKNG